MSKKTKIVVGVKQGHFYFALLQRLAWVFESLTEVLFTLGYFHISLHHYYFSWKIMVQELMVCHINSQITRGGFVFTQLSSISVEVLLPCLITQNMNSRDLWMEGKFFIGTKSTIWILNFLNFFRSCFEIIVFETKVFKYLLGIHVCFYHMTRNRLLTQWLTATFTLFVEHFARSFLPNYVENILCLNFMCSKE